MTRLVPHPLLSAGLVLMWLLLNSFTLGHLLLGTAVALVAGRAMAALVPTGPRIRNWGTLFGLLWRVTGDILRSNGAVAWIVLTGRRTGNSGFVEIDLPLRDPTALAILAVILTATPGTAWIDYDAATGRLLVHVFDLVTDAGWRDIIINRYALPLQEVFE